MARLAAVLVLSISVFAALAADLLLHGPITAADPAISLWLHAHMQPLATQLLFAVTHMHSTTGILLMSIAVAIGCAAARRTRYIPWLLLTVQGGQVLNWIAKEAFHRTRPHWDSPLLQLTTYSFPSGHAAESTVFWGFLCVLAAWWPQGRGAQRKLHILAVAMVAFTALSRVYLGAHYLSDVLAGTCEGTAWVSACALVHRMRSSPPP